MSVKKNEGSHFKINKMVSTIILGTSFSTILLFGLIFYMYYDQKAGYILALRDSFSITASFFGGIATLVAAFIASQLFNDWKVEQIYLKKIKLINHVIDTSYNLINSLLDVSVNIVLVKNCSKLISDGQIDNHVNLELLENKRHETFELKTNYSFKANTLYSNLTRLSKELNDPRFILLKENIKDKQNNIESKFINYYSEPNLLELYKTCIEIIKEIKELKLYLENDVIQFLDRNCHPD
ncbi:hypothetical protein [Acinetobacter venetianus]|uniref:hypothetical protein n=1 Tax=Acinetobacter venetianus TaxID=52133 RepID=UPI00241D27CC|nr:hypothetical protein [Acinetobacter venetianus]